MRSALHLLILTFAVLHLNQAWALEPNQIKEFEKTLEEKVRDIAQVQFGTRDSVAVNVQAHLKKVDPPPPSEPLDVGYLPAPVDNSQNNSFKNINDMIENVDVTIIASSLLDSSAVQALQTNARKVLTTYKPRMHLQVVDFSEPKSRKPASDPEKDKKDEHKEDLTKKDYILSAFFVTAVLLLGFLVFSGFRSMGKAIAQGINDLSKSFLSLKQSSNPPPTKTEEKKEEEITDNNLPPTTRPLEQCLEILSRFVTEDTMSLVSCLSSERGDLIGLRWLLSHLNEKEKNLMKSFLGMDRIRELAKPIATPKNFHLLLWAQDLTERVTLKKLQGKAFIEKVVTSDDLSVLYQADPAKCFDLAREFNNTAIWKMIIGILPATYLAERSKTMSAEEWETILESAQASPEQIRQALPEFKKRLQSQTQGTTESENVDPDFQTKVLSPLLSTLRSLPTGQDEKFMQSLAQKQPHIVTELEKKFWTFKQLRMIEANSLRSFISNLGNEVLFSLLYMANSEDRELLQSMIPEGMKRTVVLDLLEKAKTKMTEQQAAQAKQVTRETLDKAMQLNIEGRLPFSQKATA